MKCRKVTFSVLLSTLHVLQGIMHKTKPIFTAQFHPEAKGGPTDTEVIKELALKLPARCTKKYLYWIKVKFFSKVSVVKVEVLFIL